MFIDLHLWFPLKHFPLKELLTVPELTPHHPLARSKPPGGSDLRVGCAIHWGARWGPLLQHDQRGEGSQRRLHANMDQLCKDGVSQWNAKCLTRSFHIGKNIIFELLLYSVSNQTFVMSWHLKENVWILLSHQFKKAKTLTMAHYPFN